MRRICLFSGFDKNYKIQEYVVYMLKKLSDVSEVYFVTNGKVSPEERVKISPYIQRFYAQTKYKGDFGNWNYLIAQLGWNKLIKYDELILCNDSVYGPLCDLKAVFAKMERKNFDFWGITANSEHHYYLHSYFMVFNQNVLQNEKFQEFWRIVPFYTKVTDCEKDLTPLLTEQGFSCNSFIRCFGHINMLHKPEKLMENYGLPFVKIKSFLPKNEYSSGLGIKLKLKIFLKTDYDIRLINKHIRNADLPQSLTQKFMSYTGL